MNIIERYKAWRDNRRLTRLEADLNILKDRELHFNPRHISQLSEYNWEQQFSRKITEYSAWFSGDPSRIRRFYTSYSDFANIMSYFWQKAPISYRKVHSGIPALISKKMSTVLFGGGITTKITIEEKTKGNLQDINDILEKLKNKICFNEKLATGATTESWSGHVFYKLSYDINITPFPILEVVDIRNANVIKERGITTAIEFLNYYQKGETSFVHKEIYTTDESGNAVIENRMFKCNVSGNKEVPLSTFAETAALEEVVVFNGLKGMLAFDKPNKLPNAEFQQSNYGESDYAGATSAFDALDETVSEIFREIRDNKTIRYVPESMIEWEEYTDEFGYERTRPSLDRFVTNYQRVRDILSEQAKNEVSIKQIPDKTFEHLEKWKVALTLAVNKAGLSPLALGVTGLEAVNAGQESQQERNKATLETRSAKIELWKPFLENLLKQTLALNEWLRKNDLQKNDALYSTDLEMDDIQCIVEFADYIESSKAERLQVWGAAKMQGVASVEQAVREIHRDWKEVDIENEVKRINFEQGVAFDTPGNLPNLTGELEDEVKENEQH